MIVCKTELHLHGKKDIMNKKKKYNFRNDLEGEI